MKDLQGTLDGLERTPLPISILCLSFYDFAPQVKEEFDGVNNGSLSGLASVQQTWRDF